MLLMSGNADFENDIKRRDIIILKQSEILAFEKLRTEDDILIHFRVLTCQYSSLHLHEMVQLDNFQVRKQSI